MSFRSTKVLFALIAFLLLPNSSMAFDREKCEMVTDGYIFKWPYKILGFITQLNECALIDGFQIEIGAYYSDHVYGIQSDLSKGGGEEIDKLAKFVGCPPEYYPKFTEMVLTNKVDIFCNGDLLPRTVMLNLYKKVSEDDVLKNVCKRN